MGPQTTFHRFFSIYLIIQVILLFELVNCEPEDEKQPKLPDNLEFINAKSLGLSESELDKILELTGGDNQKGPKLVTLGLDAKDRKNLDEMGKYTNIEDLMPDLIQLEEILKQTKAPKTTQKPTKRSRIIKLKSLRESSSSEENSKPKSTTSKPQETTSRRSRPKNSVFKKAPPTEARSKGQIPSPKKEKSGEEEVSTSESQEKSQIVSSKQNSESDESFGSSSTTTASSASTTTSSTSSSDGVTEAPASESYEESVEFVESFEKIPKKSKTDVLKLKRTKGDYIKLKSEEYTSQEKGSESINTPTNMPPPSTFDMGPFLSNVGLSSVGQMSNLDIASYYKYLDDLMNPSGASSNVNLKSKEPSSVNSVKSIDLSESLQDGKKVKGGDKSVQQALVEIQNLLNLKQEEDKGKGLIYQQHVPALYTYLPPNYSSQSSKPSPSQLHPSQSPPSEQQVQGPPQHITYQQQQNIPHLQNVYSAMQQQHQQFILTQLPGHSGQIRGGRPSPLMLLSYPQLQPQPQYHISSRPQYIYQSQPQQQHHHQQQIESPPPSQQQHHQQQQEYYISSPYDQSGPPYHPGSPGQSRPQSQGPSILSPVSSSGTNGNIPEIIPGHAGQRQPYFVVNSQPSSSGKEVSESSAPGGSPGGGSDGPQIIPGHSGQRQPYFVVQSSSPYASPVSKIPQSESMTPGGNGGMIKESHFYAPASMSDAEIIKSLEQQGRIPSGSGPQIEYLASSSPYSPGGSSGPSSSAGQQYITSVNQLLGGGHSIGGKRPKPLLLVNKSKPPSYSSIFSGSSGPIPSPSPDYQAYLESFGGIQSQQSSISSSGPSGLSPGKPYSIYTKNKHHFSGPGRPGNSPVQNLYALGGLMGKALTSGLPNFLPLPGSYYNNYLKSSHLKNHGGPQIILNHQQHHGSSGNRFVRNNKFGPLFRV